MNDLVDRDSAAFLTQALDAAHVDYLEGPDGEAIVAAAEVVLALAGDASDDLPSELRDWVTTPSDLSAGAYRSLGIKALDRVLAANSELLDLWSEAGGEDHETWRANVDSLRRRVGEIPESSEPPPPPTLNQAEPIGINRGGSSGCDHSAPPSDQSVTLDVTRAFAPLLGSEVTIIS